jgi:cytochrome c oxidase assembly factor CtaG
MPAMNGMRPVFDLHNALTDWQSGPFAIAVVVVVVGIAYWYLRGDWHLAARGRRWPWYRTASFLLGLVLIDLALQSPVATFTADYFQAHIAQHLLLMVGAPPLLALGAPSTMLLQSSSRWVKTKWLAVLRSWPFRVLTFPPIVWALYFGAMFVFFLTPLIGFAMGHMDLMDAANIVFLFGGCLYWWPIVGTDPVVHWRMGYGAKLGNLGIGIPFEAFLGIALMQDHTTVAPIYTLASTHAGGALLWIATELSTFFGVVPVFMQWLRSDLRAAARADEARQVVAPRARGAMPLFQPGNSSWEEMWRAKAGFVPRTNGRGNGGASSAAPAPQGRAPRS